MSTFLGPPFYARGGCGAKMLCKSEVPIGAPLCEMYVSLFAILYGRFNIDFLYDSDPAEKSISVGNE